MGIGILGGGDFFQVRLENSVYKKSEYKFQAQQIIQIVISIISHFWSPTLTNLWYYVFVLLFSMVYTPPYPQIFFCGGLNFFFCVL